MQSLTEMMMQMIKVGNQSYLPFLFVQQNPNANTCRTQNTHKKKKRKKEEGRAATPPQFAKLRHPRPPCTRGKESRREFSTTKKKTPNAKTVQCDDKKKDIIT